MKAEKAIVTTTKEINKILREKVKTEKSVRVSNLAGQDNIVVNSTTKQVS